MRKLKNQYKTIIIGSGPAGLAAAVQLSENGMSDFLLLEREAETGGILNQCIHNGFGLKFFREDLTGPEFARRLEKRLPPDAAVLTAAMVSEVSPSESGGFRIKIHSRRHGLLIIKTDTVITATGCRERTRENIEVPGTRPAGVFTAGQAQALINRKHYSIGRSIVIQGSGDIGLIMARRLMIEGFNVTAVLERLPYLSGSIRNKVQCLDHFGITLHLGRQIIDIRGRDRVSAVLTSAVDENFWNISGSELEIDCDTVLFAAGLIPELETVKPAGVRLPDSFHPDINSAFETNVPGLFAAGNCLHINDLADSAAQEGFSAAASVMMYLSDKDRFRLDVNQGMPYSEHASDASLDSDYFDKIEREKLIICIVCPKGCLLKEGCFGCSRGEDYFRRTASPAGSLCQRVSTTIETSAAEIGQKQIIPAVSEDEIPVTLIPDAVAALKEAGKGLDNFDSRLEISAGEYTYIFNLCRTAAAE